MRMTLFHQSEKEKEERVRLQEQKNVSLSLYSNEKEREMVINKVNNLVVTPKFGAVLQHCNAVL